MCPRPFMRRQHQWLLLLRLPWPYLPLWLLPCLRAQLSLPSTSRRLNHTRTLTWVWPHQPLLLQQAQTPRYARRGQQLGLPSRLAHPRPRGLLHQQQPMPLPNLLLL